MHKAPHHSVLTPSRLPPQFKVSCSQSTHDVTRWIRSAVNSLFNFRLKLNISRDFHGINRSHKITSLFARSLREPVLSSLCKVLIFLAHWLKPISCIIIAVQVLHVQESQAVFVDLCFSSVSKSIMAVQFELLFAASPSKLCLRKHYLFCLPIHVVTISEP